MTSMTSINTLASEVYDFLSLDERHEKILRYWWLSFIASGIRDDDQSEFKNGQKIFQVYARSENLPEFLAGLDQSHETFNGLAQLLPFVRDLNKRHQIWTKYTSRELKPVNKVNKYFSNSYLLFFIDEVWKYLAEGNYDKFMRDILHMTALSIVLDDLSGKFLPSNYIE